MEDQGKRLILAVVAAIGIFLLWQVLFPAKQEEPPKAGSGSAAQVQPAQQNPVGAPTTPAAGSGSGSAAPAPSPEIAVHPRNAADEIAVDLAEYRATFSKWGGTLVSYQLKESRFATSAEHGELVEAAAQGGPAFGVNFANPSAVYIPQGAEWQGTRNGNVVTYVYSDDKLTVTKTFTLYPESYLVKLDVAVDAKPSAPGQPAPVLQEQLAVSVFGYQDPKQKPSSAGRVKREWSSACFVNGSVERQAIYEMKDVPHWPGGSVQWTGVDHPYFLLAMAPKNASEETLQCNVFQSPQHLGLVQVSLLYSPTSIKAGDPTFHREVWAYVGPKMVDQLERADDVAGFKTGFGRAVAFGFFTIRAIALPLLWLLHQFYGLVGNWGIAIMLLTVLVKLATLYWTTKSMRSMRAMAALKPKMDELQKKYGDDRARQQQEMMALYKTHGVNPLAGCLPMVLQMPIWMALYGMLSAAGELYNAPFVPGWINDLTAQDPYYILGIALVILMFVQARLQPASGDSMQQKMMMYGLPGVFGVMSLFFPSGLTLYILTNTVLTSFHSLYMRKFDKSAKLIPAVKATAKPSRDDKREDKRDDKPAKRVEPATAIDVEGEERVDDDGDDESDDDADDAASAKASANKPGKGPAQKNANRPRRGQRRRGRN